MTQPPYGAGPPPPPDGQQPAYPPPVDPYAAPGPTPYPPVEQYPAPPYPPQQPVSGQPYAQPQQPVSGQPYGPPQPVSGQPYPQVPGQPVPGQPIPGQPIPGQPISGQPMPGQPMSAQPYSGPPGPGYPTMQPYPPTDPNFPPTGYPAYLGAPAAPPKKKRGLLIGLIAAGVVLVLCGVGGVAAFMLTRNIEPNDGAAEPAAAVQDFLKAVYTDQDVEAANDLVCAESRDKVAVTKKIDEVKDYATKYKVPRFSWDEPKVEDQTSEQAKVLVKLTMNTGDEKTSQQELSFVVVQKTGWFVCEVSS